MSSYAIPCPHCDHIADSWDSYGDTRQELEEHLMGYHPDLPDPLRRPSADDPRRTRGSA